jgi:hypothetical protein
MPKSETGKCAVQKVGLLLPVYPDEPTIQSSAQTSHSGQFRTHALQQGALEITMAT